MTMCLGTVPAGTTIYIPFSTYGKTNGESITLSGLAVTDIEIYKNGSTTQRASDAGYTLLDTDGIDFDSITGIHGFSIDLSDNTDAGFFAVGSWYWVVVSSVTVDSQTVNFVAGVFRIGPAESVAGYPKADVSHIAGSSVSTSSAQIGVNVVNAGGTAWGSGAITAASVAADAANEIADAVLDRDMSTGSDNGSATVRTPRQALRFLRNKWSIAAGTLTVCKEDDSTTSWTSALTTNASAEPVTTSDPASS